MKAEKRVMEELLADATRVRGKAGILFNIARAALADPDGAVRDVIFPVAGCRDQDRAPRRPSAAPPDCGECGFDGSVVVGKVLETEDPGFDFDAHMETYRDMLKAGIIDPIKVVRIALENVT